MSIISKQYKNLLEEQKANFKELERENSKYKTRNMEKGQQLKKG